MLKVLDYFNLGDIYKFLPEDQKVGTRSRSQSIEEPGGNDFVSNFPMDLDDNDNDNDNYENESDGKWILLNGSPVKKKRPIKFFHAMNSSDTQFESKAQSFSSSLKPRSQLTLSSAIIATSSSPSSLSSSSNRQMQEGEIEEDQGIHCRSEPQNIVGMPKSPSSKPMGNTVYSSSLDGIGGGNSYGGDVSKNCLGTPHSLDPLIDLSNSPAEFPSDEKLISPPQLEPSSLKNELGAIINDDGIDYEDNEIDEKDEKDEEKDGDITDDSKSDVISKKEALIDNNSYTYDDNIGHDENLRLSYQKACPGVTITVVGQEPDGILLLCVHNMDKTFLDLFTLEEMEIVCLCTWNGSVDVTCASIDKQHRVVAVSVKNTINPHEIGDDKHLRKLLQGREFGPDERCVVYSTFAQCVNDDTGKMPWVGKRSLHPQEVHFTCNHNKNTSQLVLITLSVSIKLYTITLGTPFFSFSDIMYIQKKPKELAIITGEYLWSRYDYRYKLIYYIAPKVNTSLLELFVVSVKKPIPKVIARCPMSTFFGLKKNDLYSPSWGSYPLPYIIGAINEHPPPPLPCITTVVLPSSQAICICVQHEIDTRNPDYYLIPISIVPLKLQVRIDYSIPISRDTVDAGCTRVVFGSIADFLMVFIPGAYLHLLDISDLHNPTLGIILTGHDTATFYGRQNAKESRWEGAPLACIDLAYYDQRPGYGVMLQHAFLDMRTGVICEFGINKKSILNLPDAGISSEKALHIAMTHMRDEELVDQLVRNVLQGPSCRATPEFFKEYIIGQTFLSIRNSFPEQLLSSTPATTELSKCTKICKTSVSPVTSPRGGFDFKSVPSYELRNYWRSIAPNNEQHASSTKLPHLLSHKKPVVSYKTAYMEPYMRLVEREKKICARDPNIQTPLGKRLDSVLQKWMESISILCPNAIPEPEMQRYAESYHEAQSKSVEVLFSTIVSALPDDIGKKRSPRTRKLFLVLERFLSAITELDDIFLPPGFDKKFSSIGYHCLPRPVFLQYIRRGLISVSKELVLAMYEKGVHKSDPDVFYSLLCGLPLYAAVDVLLSDPRNPPPPLYLVEFFLSKYSKTLASSEHELNYDSPFYPLEVFLLSLKSGVEQLNDYKMVSDGSLTPSIRELFNDIDVLSRIVEMVDMDYFLPTLEFDLS